MPKDYSSYLGQKAISEDVVCASQVQRMSVTLDRDEPYPQPGDPVPSGWNYIFFPNLVRTKDLAEDGTIADSAFALKTDLPLRWLAGSRASYYRPMRIGDRIEQVSELTSVRSKVGRTGELLFVTQRQTISNQDGPVMMEEWDIVYREAVKSNGQQPPGEPAPQDFAWERTVHPNTSFLFRFSAVNFNPRRLHYDYDYSTRVEGLPGLVIHGPLTGILLMELARDNGAGRRLGSFEMRAKAPVLSDRPLKLLGQPSADGTACELWAVLPDNTVAMSATATFADQ